jgi:hypothetical protein
VEGDGRWKRLKQIFDEVEAATVIPEVEAVAEISVSGGCSRDDCDRDDCGT